MSKLNKKSIDRIQQSIEILRDGVREFDYISIKKAKKFLRDIYTNIRDVIMNRIGEWGQEKGYYIYDSTEGLSSTESNSKYDKLSHLFITKFWAIDYPDIKGLFEELGDPDVTCNLTDMIYRALELVDDPNTWKTKSGYCLITFIDFINWCLWHDYIKNDKYIIPELYNGSNMVLCNLEGVLIDERQYIWEIHRFHTKKTIEFKCNSGELYKKLLEINKNPIDLLETYSLKEKLTVGKYTEKNIPKQKDIYETKSPTELLENGYTLSLRHFVMSPHCNSTDNLFGGQLLAWIDEGAAMYAATYMQHNKLVTVSINAVEFKKPIPKGHICSVYCKVHREGHTSLTLDVVVMRTSYDTNSYEKVTSTKIVFVAVDENFKSTPWKTI